MDEPQGLAWIPPMLVMHMLITMLVVHTFLMALVTDRNLGTRSWAMWMCHGPRVHTETVQTRDHVAGSTSVSIVSIIELR